MGEKTKADRIVQGDFYFRGDFARDISLKSLLQFQKKHNLSSTTIKDDVINAIEEAVQNHEISLVEVTTFIKNELKYGHNRSLYFNEIDQASVLQLRKLNEEDLVKILSSKGWKVEESSLVDIYLPKKMLLCDLYFEMGKQIDFTFVETIQTKRKDVVTRENNYYFVSLDLINSTVQIRIRPRSNIAKLDGSGNIVELINSNLHFYKIKREIISIFGFELIDSTFFKTVLYKIAKKLTEEAENEWKDKLDVCKDEIELFDIEIQKKLPEINSLQFNFSFRLKRLIERALIQSNYKKNTQNKIGYVQMFDFSDKTGGKIKAKTKEDKEIQSSDLYYDVRDTIDSVKSLDNLWVHWFLSPTKTIRTKFEVTSEYYLIHFYKYLDEDELKNVLSKVESFKRSG